MQIGGAHDPAGGWGAGRRGMSFNWRRERQARYVYDATWAVEQHGGPWYVIRDGKCLLEDYARPDEAMEAAERMIQAQSTTETQ